MKRFLIAALFLFFCFASCSKKTTNVEPDEAKARFTFINSLSQLNVNMLKITFNDGSSTRSVNGSQFYIDSTFLQYHTNWYTTPLSGTLSLSYILTDTTGDTISQGSAAIPLKSDWAWQFDICPDHHNPYYYSFGVVGFKAFSINPAYCDSTTDSIFVLWGGNSIKNPVVY